MGEVLPLPARGEVFTDSRGEGRTLRVSWHQDEHTLVLSMWHLGDCRATFRLPSAEAPALIHALVSGLSGGLTAERESAAGGPLATLRSLHPEVVPTTEAEPTVAGATPPPGGPETGETAASQGVADSSDAATPPAPPAVFIAPPNLA